MVREAQPSSGVISRDQVQGEETPARVDNRPELTIALHSHAYGASSPSVKNREAAPRVVLQCIALQSGLRPYDDNPVCRRILDSVPIEPAKTEVKAGDRSIDGEPL